jgi:hypothetical protein
MQTSIQDQVVDFFDTLFESIFSEPFRERIPEPLKRRAVIRDIQEAADAASQSLTRFFLNEQLTKAQVEEVLNGFAELRELLKLDDISNPNIVPESVVAELLPKLPPPEAVKRASQEAVYRVALHSIVQVLMLVGPVMAEWRKRNFSTTFELLRRIVNRLNQISKQLDALGHAGQAAMDERYELTYRDYLLQRFHRIEVGTVRMTTNMDVVDLRELFVMPRVSARSLPEAAKEAESSDAVGLMDLVAVRQSLVERREQSESEVEKNGGVLALEQVKRYPRNVIVGTPGSGKSTFLEWLQLKLAAVEEELVMAGQQAIPLLLRVRQLDARNLPRGTALIEKATGSRDRSILMPPGWLDRQMGAGRVLFMLDGLDETEPGLRDRYILPWLLSLCKHYPNCRYLVSSRPVGYLPGTLRKLEFVECELLDFNETQINEYTQQWCTAVRLSRNEPDAEARREGKTDGDTIVEGFKGHPYIQDLVHNPLMLSAVCLVNYFESGQLPEDRALLYQLCVEGLLHHWDARRGIHSEFGLDEKLRVCREVAIAMQADDKAEYPAAEIKRIFGEVLGSFERSAQLLEHIRYRTGLLLERRPEVFAFAHLTFQEYLAARAVYEGNRCGVDMGLLVHEHDDGRWKEVIALYCGLAPSRVARDLIERLILKSNTRFLSQVLAEAYLSAGIELSQDHEFRQRVLERIAVAPTSRAPRCILGRFSADEVSPIAHQWVGKMGDTIGISESYVWLYLHPDRLNPTYIAKQLRAWRDMTPFQTSGLMYLVHRYGHGSLLAEIATDQEIYSAPGPHFSDTMVYTSQAEIALIGLSWRGSEGILNLPGANAAILQILRALSSLEKVDFPAHFYISISRLLQGRGREYKTAWLPENEANWLEFVTQVRQLARRLTDIKDSHQSRKRAIKALNTWADSLEKAIAEREEAQSEPKNPSTGDNPP